MKFLQLAAISLLSFSSALALADVDFTSIPVETASALSCHTNVEDLADISPVIVAQNGIGKLTFFINTSDAPLEFAVTSVAEGNGGGVQTLTYEGQRDVTFGGIFASKQDVSLVVDLRDRHPIFNRYFKSKLVSTGMDVIPGAFPETFYCMVLPR